MSRARLPAALLLAGAVAQPLAAQEPGSSCSNDSRLRGRIAELARGRGEPVRQTVEQIDGAGRRLLALRSYLRSGDSLAERWSWSQAEIDAYAGSDEHRALLAEVDEIRGRFEAANPGFELYANTDVRSLGQQIERWNGNETVGRLAADLLHAVCELKPSDGAALRELLDGWVLEVPAPLAAPGLSAHGQARAVDFQVHREGRVIAGPVTATAAADWVAAGWAAKLAAAIAAGNDKLVGPLEQPNEPWHFEYRP